MFITNNRASFYYIKKSQNIMTMIVVKHFDANQWKSSNTVIDWFKGIENIKYCIFIKFDIRKFYPPILENKLKKRFHLQEGTIIYPTKRLD